MENLAPILIGLIWLAFKFFQKRESKTAKRSATTSAHVKAPASQSEGLGDKVEFEKYIQDFFGGSTPSQKEDIESETNYAEAYSSNEEGEAPNINVPYESIEYQKDDVDTASRISSDVGKAKKKVTHPLVADFDLKKAIIYSEILKPKYF